MNDHVLQVTDCFQEGSYTYSVLGYSNKPSFLHINNHKTNKNSVLVPIDVIKNIIDISVLKKLS